MLIMRIFIGIILSMSAMYVLIAVTVAVVDASKPPQKPSIVRMGSAR